MTEPKRPNSFVFNEAMLKGFMDGTLEPAVEENVAKLLEARPELLERISSRSGDGFLKRLREVQQRSSEGSQVHINAEIVEPAQIEKSAIKRDRSIPAALTNYSGYKIIKELGRGGMGVVYLAKNIQLDRLEVLKVLNENLLDHEGAKERFLREIRAVSKLSHTHIVASYSILPLDDLLVFVMEYVQGIDLHKYICKNKPLAIATCCSLAKQLASGLQHAHSRGLVHRDIKPSNAIVYEADRRLLVKILDFGLAKATSEKKLAGLTQDGTMLGTPEYMSPEQTLDAAKADIRADIYSLGCTLYHMLSGKPPFTGTHGAILLAHAQREPAALNLVRPDVSTQLAAVVAKMMAKSPDKRYQTPAEASDALTPFLQQLRQPSTLVELASASSPSNTINELKSPEIDTSVEESRLQLSSVARVASKNDRERAKRQWHWPVVVAVIGSLVSAALISLLGTLVFKRPNGTILVENLPADAEVRVDGKQLEDILHLPSQAQINDQANSITNKNEAGSFQLPAESLDVYSAEAAKIRARMYYEAKQADRTEAGRALVRKLQQVRWPVDLLDRNAIPPEELLNVGGDSRAAPAELVAVLGNSRWKSVDQIVALDVSVSQETVISGSRDGMVTVWNPKTGAIQKFIKVTDADLTQVTLNRSGSGFLSCGGDRKIKLWDVVAGKLLRTFDGHEGTVTAAVFSHDEKSIYSAGSDKRICVWNAITGICEKQLPTYAIPLTLLSHPSKPTLIVNGKKDGTLVLWNVQTGKMEREVDTGSGKVCGVDFSPDGKYLAASLLTGEVAICDVNSDYKVVKTRKFDQPPIRAIQFSNDSRTLAVGTKSDALTWDIGSDEIRWKNGITGPAHSIKPLHDKLLLATGHWIDVINSRGKFVYSDTAPITKATVSPDGISVALTSTVVNRLEIWNLAGELTSKVPKGNAKNISGMGFSTDGQSLFTAGGIWQPKIWDIHSGEKTSQFGRHDGYVTDLDVASDGARFCTCSGDMTALVWDIQSSNQLLVFRGHSKPIKSCRFSPDATKVISASNDGVVKIWDSKSGDELLPSLPTANNGFAVAFRPFSEEVAVADGNNITIHKLPGGASPRSLVGHRATVLDLDYNLDGSKVVTSSKDGTVRIWNAESGEQQKLIRVHAGKGEISTARFTPEGRHVIIINGSGVCCILRVEAAASG